jgi:hypothetical protein
LTTSSRTSVLSERPPAADEGEITIFGPGVGECIVVHLGGGQWMVVDSCRDGDEPTALRYLRTLGLDGSVVKWLLLTHWHDDHIGGASKVLAATPNAQFACSVALNIKEFNQLLTAYDRAALLEPGVTEMVQIFRYCRLKNNASKRIGPVWVASGRVLIEAPSLVRVLSPSDATIERAFEQLGRLVPILGPKLRPVAQGPNQLAVTLWLEIGGVRAILGADLECSNDPQRGWSGVIQAMKDAPHKAAVFKVPHHGSAGADERTVWSTLLEPDCIAVVTPYNALYEPIPTAAARKLLASRTSNAYLTAQVGGRRSRRSADVDKQVRRMTGGMQELTRPNGRVRIRWRFGTMPSVEVADGASRLRTVS